MFFFISVVMLLSKKQIPYFIFFLNQEFFSKHKCKNCETCELCCFISSRRIRDFSSFSVLQVRPEHMTQCKVPNSLKNLTFYKHCDHAPYNFFCFFTDRSHKRLRNNSFINSGAVDDRFVTTR